MSKLWADKYRPSNFNNLDYHKEQAKDLRNLTKEGDFPHLLIYGPMGAGKKTRIMCLLNELYGPGVEKLKVDNVQFTTPSNKKLELTTLSSNYHIEVNPSDAGIYDRVVIMDIIKNVAQMHQMNANSQRDFKVVVLTDVDGLTKDAQHALRRTMEKYISYCRLILCATTISQIIPAIRSRCLCIRVPAPTCDQIVEILNTTSTKENIKLPPELARRIAEKSDRNLRRALLMLETCKVERYPFTADQEVALPDWQTFIRNEIAGTVLKEQSVNALLKMRENLYELIINDIPAEVIFKIFLDTLLNKCDPVVCGQIVEKAALFDYRMAQGNKAIVHLEAFIASCMCLYQGMLQEMQMDF